MSKTPLIMSLDHGQAGCGSQGVAVNNYFNFIHHLGGACEAKKRVLKKCWISERARLFPWPPRSSFAVLAVPFSLDICDLWAVAAYESKLNTSNRRHFHLRKMRCFFYPVWACPCFRNSAQVARSKRECFSLQMICYACLRYGWHLQQCSIWLVHIVIKQITHKEATRVGYTNRRSLRKRKYLASKG